MLSLTSTLSNGVLSITGTDDNDQLSLRYDAADILIEYSTLSNGQATQSGSIRHSIAEVSEIRVRGLQGDDIIDASGVGLPLNLVGDAGNDVLIGGSGNDSLNGGPGDDRLDGRDGVDTIVPSSGNDVVTVSSHNLVGAFLESWIQAGGEGGELGPPVDSAQDGTGAVRSQRFNTGLLYTSPQTGVVAVPYHLPPAARTLFDEAYDPVRHELLSRFFFNGFIADRIWYVNGQARIKFGDQGKQMGDALLLFAQEAAILQSGGYDPEPSENVVRIILNAFDQMDRDGEVALYGDSRRSKGFTTGELPGFFLRDYVGISGPERQGIPTAIYGDRIYSDYLNGLLGRAALRGTPGVDPALLHKYTDPVLSADQAAHLLSGWWAVAKYSTSAESVARAQDQARRVIGYFMGVGYVLPAIDGVAVKPSRGADARLNAGFLSHMADKVTGDDYFWRPSNGIYLGDVNSGAIRDAVRQAVRVYVDAATAGLSRAARDIFNWDPVGDVIDALTNRIPDWTRIELPVWFAHNALLTITDQTGSLWESAFTGSIGLNQFAPSPLRQIMNSISFDVPTGAKVSFFPPSVSLKTKTVSLASLLGEIKVAVPGGIKVSPYARSLGLLMAAFDPDELRMGSRFQDLAMADQNVVNPAYEPNAWVALIRPAVQAQSPSPEVVRISKEIRDSGPTEGSRTNQPEGWSSRNRWEWPGENVASNSDGDDRKNNTGAPIEFTSEVHATQFNGIDFLSFDTLIRSRGLVSSYVGPPVEYLPSVEDPSRRDLHVRGDYGANTITLARRDGTNIDVVVNGKSWGLWNPDGQVFVHGLGGNDFVTVDGELGVQASIFGGDGDDTVILSRSAGARVLFSGGDGSDTLRGGDADRTWHITGPNFGTTSTGGIFSGVESLVGGALVDTFVFESGGKLDGGVYGGVGVDSINLADMRPQEIALKSEGAIDGFNGEFLGQQSAVRTFFDIDVVIGSDSQAADRLVGLDQDAAWRVSADGNDYTLRSSGRRLLFDQIDELWGGAEVDAFDVSELAAALVIQGGGGSDAVALATGNLDNIAGIVTVLGGDGTGDRITVDDGGVLRDVDYRISPTTVRSSEQTGRHASSAGPERIFPGLNYDSTTEHVSLVGSDGVNVFDVQPSLATAYALDGNGPLPGFVEASKGDYLKLDTKTTFPEDLRGFGLDTSGRRLSIESRGQGRWDFTKGTGHQSVGFESFERFNHVDVVAAAADAGKTSSPVVHVFDSETLEPLFTIPATSTFGRAYRGGVRVATGDLDNDGLPDVAVAPGRMAAPVVKVFNGSPQPDLQGTEILNQRLAARTTFGARYAGGVNITVGDVTGDTLNEVILSRSRGPAVVKVFENSLVPGIPFAQLGQAAARAFNAFPRPRRYQGGSSVAVADVGGLGKQQIVVGSGVGMRGLVRVFDVRTPAATYAAMMQIVDPTVPAIRGGLHVAAGDLDGDGRAEIVTGAGAAGGSRVRIYNGADGSHAFMLQTGTRLAATIPARVAVRSIDGDSRMAVFATWGADARRNYRIMRMDSPLRQTIDELRVSGSGLSGGGINIG